VQRGAFGACLMAEPALVADCVAAMRDAVVGDLPVTVKHRIGIDRSESYDFVRDFVGTVAAAGARCSSCMRATPGCKGLSPKENREVPALALRVCAPAQGRFPGADDRGQRRHQHHARRRSRSSCSRWTA
jgi:tRNA-dihydrouridine synthase A